MPPMTGVHYATIAYPQQLYEATGDDADHTDEVTEEEFESDPFFLVILCQKRHQARSEGAESPIATWIPLSFELSPQLLNLHHQASRDA